MSEDDSCWEKPGIGQPLCPSPERARLKRSTRRTRVAFLQQRRMFLHQSKQCCPIPIRSPRPPTPLPAFPFPSHHRCPHLSPPLAQPRGCDSLFTSPSGRCPQEIFPSWPWPRAADVHHATPQQLTSHRVAFLGDDAPPGPTHHPHLSGISPPCPPCDPRGWRG